MPNWVNNSVTVRGQGADIKAFREKAGREYSHNGETSNRCFSFMNFIAPPQEAIDSGEYWGTHGFVNGEHSGQTANNWYNWNNREWGTKWDACEEELEQEGDFFLRYRFDTAWAPPEPVFRAMIAQHPTLEFEIRSVEEQGWGVELESDGEGNMIVKDEWDIPDNHEDSMRRTDTCICEYYDANDLEEWKTLFDDCPSKHLDTASAVARLEEIEAKLSV